MFFKTVSPTKSCALQKHTSFHFFHFSVISLAFHSAGCFPWPFLFSCAMKARYSISALLKPWLRSRGSISFAGPQEQFPGWQQKQGKNKADQNKWKSTLCFGWFFVLVFFFEVGRVAELVYLFCFGSFWGGGGGCWQTSTKKKKLGLILTEMVLKGEALHMPHVQQQKQAAPYPHLGCSAVSRDTNRDAEGTTPVPVTRAVRALPQAFGIRAGGRGGQERRRGNGKGERSGGRGARELREMRGMLPTCPAATSSALGEQLPKHLPEAGLPPLKEASGSSSSRNLASQHPPRPAAPHTLSRPAGPPAPGRLLATLTK